MYHFYEWFPNRQEDGPFRAFKINGLNFNAHLHMQFEFAYVLSGGITVNISDKKKTLVENEFCIVSSNLIHNYETTEDNQVFVMIFEPQFVPEFTRLFKGRRPGNPFMEAQDDSAEYVLAIERLLAERKSGNNSLVMQGYAYVLLGKLRALLKFDEDYSVESSALQNVLRFVEANYDNEISLETLSREIGVSRYHISRLFNEKIGCGFNDYIKMMRINKATRLLMTDMPIIQVAMECGYENTRSFYRAFQEVCHVTPAKFRSINPAAQ